MKREDVEKIVAKIIEKQAKKKGTRMEQTEEKKVNLDSLPFSSYAYSLWLRIIKKNSDAVYKQPKMFQGFLDLCFLSGLYSDIKENLYDNLTLNPLNFYKKREEIIYKAKYNYVVGRKIYTFLILANWLHELFHARDVSGLVFFKNHAMELFEKVILDLNALGSPSFRLKTVTERINPHCLPYDPDKPSYETQNRRRIRSRPREGGNIEKRGQISKPGQWRIRSMDISEDKEREQESQSSEQIDDESVQRKGRGRKPRSEAVIDKTNENEEVNLSHEEFLSMIFCVLLRVGVRLKKYHAEDMKDKDFQQLIKRLYLLELNIKIYYEEFTREGNNELTVTLGNLAKEKSLGVTYEDIRPVLRFLSRKGFSVLINKVLPQTIKATLAEYQGVNSSEHVEIIQAKKLEIIGLFLLLNSLKYDQNYHEICKVPKREIYCDILKDIWEFNQLKQIFKEAPRPCLENFLNRVCDTFNYKFIEPSRKKLEAFVLSEKIFCEDENDMERIKKRYSDFQVMESIIAYEILYWYILDIYLQSQDITHKQGIRYYMQLYTKLGLHENLNKYFFEDPNAVVVAKGAPKKKRKTNVDYMDLAGEFYHMNITYMFKIPVLHKYSKKVLEDILVHVETSLANVKISPLDEIKYQELGEILDLEDRYLNSYAYVLSQYFFVLGDIIHRDHAKDSVTKTQKTVSWNTNQSNTEENPHSNQKTLYKFTSEDFFTMFTPKLDFFENVQKRLQRCDHTLEHDALLVDNKVFGSNVWDFLGIYNPMILINVKFANCIALTKKLLSVSCSLGEDYTSLLGNLHYMIKDLEDYVQHQYSNSCSAIGNAHRMQKNKEKENNPDYKEEKKYLKEWNWLIKFIKAIFETLEVVYMKDTEMLLSLKDEHVFKNVIGLANPMRSFTYLGKFILF